MLMALVMLAASSEVFTAVGARLWYVRIRPEFVVNAGAGVVKVRPVLPCQCLVRHIWMLRGKM